MKIEPGVTKRSVILLWCVSISGFLFYFSIGLSTEISFFNFINFTILLFGGGIAYHVTTELISCPQTECNYSDWINLLLKIAKIFVGYVIAGVALYFGKKFDGNWGWLLALLGLLLGYFWVTHHLLNLHKPIQELLKSSNK